MVAKTVTCHFYLAHHLEMDKADIGQLGGSVLRSGIMAFGNLRGAGPVLPL